MHTDFRVEHTEYNNDVMRNIVKFCNTELYGFQVTSCAHSAIVVVSILGISLPNHEKVHILNVAPTHPPTLFFNLPITILFFVKYSRVRYN